MGGLTEKSEPLDYHFTKLYNGFSGDAAGSYIFI
jgi:hypothetical protein